jgi:hypothetical protein
MINRLEFLIMFFGFGTWFLLKDNDLNGVIFIFMVVSGLAWAVCFLDDWSHRNDYEEDN